MSNIKRYICPEVKTPHQQYKSSSPSSYPSKQPIKTQSFTTKRELRQISTEIKEFSKQNDEYCRKRRYIDDKLTQLGATPMKKQKMPMKMALNILNYKKKKELTDHMKIKESGLILANTSKRSRVSSVNKKIDDDIGDINHSTILKPSKNGIFKIDQEFLKNSKVYSKMNVETSSRTSNHDKELLTRTSKPITHEKKWLRKGSR